jgi:hypothetical protein
MEQRNVPSHRYRRSALGAGSFSSRQVEEFAPATPGGSWGAAGALSSARANFGPKGCGRPHFAIV